MNISALILAAGKSERMGTPKLVLSWRGKPILSHVIDNALEGGVSEAVVVLGHEAELIEEKAIKVFPNKPVRVAYNPQYASGMLSSIQCGLKALRNTTEAVLLALGDQPTVPSSVYRTLIESFPTCRKGILIPRFCGKRGHPLIIHKKHFPFLLALDPTRESLHQLTSSFPEDICHLDLKNKEVLIDLDRPEDFERLTGKESV